MPFYLSSDNLAKYLAYFFYVLRKMIIFALDISMLNP